MSIDHGQGDEGRLSPSGLSAEDEDLRLLERVDDLFPVGGDRQLRTLLLQFPEWDVSMVGLWELIERGGKAHQHCLIGRGRLPTLKRRPDLSCLVLRERCQGWRWRRGETSFKARDQLGSVLALRLQSSEEDAIVSEDH